MAINLAIYECADEDYIEMELSSSSSNFLCFSTNSSSQSIEFEFQMPNTCKDKEFTISSADELFHKGKLLPLPLPPRRQMVQNLLHSTTTTVEITRETFEEDHYFTLSLVNSSTALPCTNSNTPLNSCNISPSESCRESCELNLDDCLFEWPTEFSSFINDHPTKRSWSKKLKLIKHSILGQKLKISKAFLKSLFNKSACSDESCAKANCNPKAENLSNAEEYSNKFIKKNPFGVVGRTTCPSTNTVIKNIDKEGIEDNFHRNSFSDAIKRHSPTKFLSSYSSSNSSSGASSSSPSSSFSLDGFHTSNYLRRSSSATEIEGSIEAAIDHCKKSQQILDKFLDCYCIDL